MRIKIFNKVLSFKTCLYPRQCDVSGKGICEGWTDEHIIMSDECFEKNPEWKEMAKTEWEKYEKDNSYNPIVYKTAWNFELYDEVGYDKYGREYNLNPYNRDEYELENGE